MLAPSIRCKCSTPDRRVQGAASSQPGPLYGVSFDAGNTDRNGHCAGGDFSITIFESLPLFEETRS